MKNRAAARARPVHFLRRPKSTTSRCRRRICHQVEREINRYKQAAQKAEAAAKEAQEELPRSKKEGDQVSKEREVLSEKIGQLVDKVKSLAAERDVVQAKLQEAMQVNGQLEANAASAEKARAKAKKAVDIAVQLVGETGL